MQATFDPVGSTATLVIERFRQHGMEPSRATAMLLLGAVLSDTVILNSPTTTERDHAVIAYLEQVLTLDAREFGQEMFEHTTDLTHVAAKEIVGRDVKQYDAGGGQTLRIAQVETVGNALVERRAELTEALEELREREGDTLAALMVTDILAKGTELYVSGDRAAVQRAFGDRPATRVRTARRDEPQEAGCPAAARRTRERRLILEARSSRSTSTIITPPRRPARLRRWSQGAVAVAGTRVVDPAAVVRVPSLASFELRRHNIAVGVVDWRGANGANR